MSLYDVAKDAFKLAQKSNDAELIQKIIEVQSLALDMQEKQQRQQTRIGDLESEKEDLRRALKQKDDFVLDKSVYWRKDDTGHDQPYCPVCYANDKLMPLQKVWDQHPKEQSPWKCPNKSCAATYNPWDHKEHSSPHIPFRNSPWPDQF